jgi:tetratricopeptide (TPR) repeat protein
LNERPLAEYVEWMKYIRKKSLKTNYYSRVYGVFSFLICLFLLGSMCWGQDEDDRQDDDKNAEPEVVYLLKAKNVSISSDGLKRTVIHEKIKILKKSAIENFGDLSIEYNGYYENAIILEAFTVSPDGKRTELAKNAIHDVVPATFADYKIYSDMRTISFSMPTIQVGSIIDYQVEIVQKEAIIPGHVWDICYMDAAQMVNTSVYSVAFPEKMAINISTQNMTCVPVVEHKSGRKTFTWTLNDVPALEYEPDMPPFNDVRSAIHVTSIESWPEIAEWYEDLIKGCDKVTPEIAKLATRLTDGKTNHIEKIRALYLYAQKDIRYVGIAVGRGAYKPHDAADCLKHEYGDCKDKSVLLLALLQQAGLKAHIALVRTSVFGKLVRSSPNPAQFNHAIVYVPLETGELWLDATAKYFDESSYPDELDGTEALVIGAGLNTFVTIPPLPKEKSIARTIYDVNMKADGTCIVMETYEMKGRAGAYARVFYENMKPDERKMSCERSVKDMPGNTRLISFGNSDQYDVANPFKTWIEYETDGFLDQSVHGYNLTLSANSLSSGLELHEPWRHRRRSTVIPRKFNLERLSYESNEIVCRIKLPKGYMLSPQPKPQQCKLPHGVIDIRTTQAEGVVETIVGVYENPVTVSPNDWRDLKRETDRALAGNSVTLMLVDRIAQLLSESKPGRAIGQLEAWLNESPDDADLHSRYGRALSLVGRLYAARQAFEASLKLNPSSLAVYKEYLKTYMIQPGDSPRAFNREKIVEILDRAIMHASDGTSAKLLLANIYEIGENGDRFGDGALLEKAAEIYEELLKESKEDDAIFARQADCLFAQGKYEESASIYAKAAELSSQDVRHISGIWTADAFKGKPYRAIDQIMAYYEDNDSRIYEIARVSGLLIGKRRYSEAAVLFEQIAAMSANKFAQLRGMPTLLRRLDVADKMDFKTYSDLTSPRSIVTSCMAAMMYSDVDRFMDAFSKRLDLSKADAWDGISVMKRMHGEQIGESRDFVLDLFATEWTCSEKLLPGGELELRLFPPAELNQKPQAQRGLTVQLIKEGDGWRICGIGQAKVDASMMAMMAASFIDENNMEKASLFIYRAADSEGHPDQGGAGENASLPTLRALQSEHFPDEDSLTLAMTGVALLSAQKNEKALAYIRKAAAMVPGIRPLDRVHAIALLENDDPNAAVDILSALVAGNSRDKLSLGLLVNALSIADRASEADKYADQLLAAPGVSTSARMTKIDVCVSAGQYDKALKEFDHIKDSLAPIMALTKEIMLRTRLGETSRVQEMLDDATLSKPAPAFVRILLGNEFSIVGQHKMAIEQYECVLIDHPRNPFAIAQIAAHLLLLDDTNEVATLVGCMKNLTTIPPDAVFKIAALDFALGNYENAIELFSNTAKNVKPSRRVYSLMMSGVCNLHLGRKEKAAEDFASAAKAHNTEEWPLHILKFLTEGLSFESMIEKAQEANSPDMKHNHLCEAYYYAGIKALSDGKKEMGLELLRKAVETKSYLTTEHMFAHVVLKKGSL